MIHFLPEIFCLYVNAISHNVFFRSVVLYKSLEFSQGGVVLFLFLSLSIRFK